MPWSRGMMCLRFTLSGRSPHEVRTNITKPLLPEAPVPIIWGWANQGSIAVKINPRLYILQPIGRQHPTLNHHHACYITKNKAGIIQWVTICSWVLYDQLLHPNLAFCNHSFKSTVLFYSHHLVQHLNAHGPKFPCICMLGLHRYGTDILLTDFNDGQR